VKGPSFEVLAALVEPLPAERKAFIERSLRLARARRSGGFPLDEPAARRFAARAFDRAYHPSGVHRQLVAIWASGTRKPALAALRVPTLVIHGDADPLIPVENGRDTAAIAGAASRSSRAWATSCRARCGPAWSARWRVWPPLPGRETIAARP
jgi:pimeloyl-ACP methyl ester carboxylesterase